MKKMFLAALAVSLMTVSAFGVNGKVGKIKIDGDNGIIIVGILDANNVEIAAKKLVGSENGIKAMLATALTAKSTNAEVSFTERSGVGGWSVVIIK